MSGQPLPDRKSAQIVLIVDDVPDNLSVLHDALDESGYIVLVATNGESALQRADRDRLGQCIRQGSGQRRGHRR